MQREEFKWEYSYETLRMCEIVWPFLSDANPQKINSASIIRFLLTRRQYLISYLYIIHSSRAYDDSKYYYDESNHPSLLGNYKSSQRQEVTKKQRKTIKSVQCVTLDFWWWGSANQPLIIQKLSTQPEVNWELSRLYLISLRSILFRKGSSCNVGIYLRTFKAFIFVGFIKGHTVLHFCWWLIECRG